MTYRVRATCPFGSALPTPASDVASIPPPEPSGSRRATFTAADGFVDVPVFRYDDLRIRTVLSGPAFVEGSESATLLPPAVELTVDALGNMHLRSVAAAAEVETNVRNPDE